MDYPFKLILVCTFCIFIKARGQDLTPVKGKVRVGFNYGFGSQQRFPFDFTDYTYDVKFYKIQFNYRFSQKTKWAFETNIEPSLYTNKHQLLNKFYVQPGFGEDYKEKREEFTQLKKLNEYVLNIGIVARYNLFANLSTYALGSIGPMYSDTDTERMQAGFAFSDIIALGISYQINDLSLDFRYSMRHVSNANLSSPNNGYNSMNYEFGFTYAL